MEFRSLPLATYGRIERKLRSTCLRAIVLPLLRRDWLAEDSTDPGYQLLTDSEIVAEVTRGGDSLDPESDDEVEPQPTVSHAQAFDAFETALKWLEGQSDTDPFHLLLVRKWRDTAAQKRVQTLKQTTLLSYLA